MYGFCDLYGFSSMLSLNHALPPQTTVRVTNETDQNQQIIFYGGNNVLQPVQGGRAPSGIIQPGQFADYTFIPQATRRLVSVLTNPNNILGTSRATCTLRSTRAFVEMTIQDLVNCSLE